MKPKKLADAAQAPQKEFIAWLNIKDAQTKYAYAGSKVAPLAEWLTLLCGKEVLVGAYSCHHKEKGTLQGHQPLAPWMRDLVAHLTGPTAWDYEKPLTQEELAPARTSWFLTSPPTTTKEVYSLVQWRRVAGI